MKTVCKNSEKPLDGGAPVIIIELFEHKQLGIIVKLKLVELEKVFNTFVIAAVQVML